MSGEASRSDSKAFHPAEELSDSPAASSHHGQECRWRSPTAHGSYRRTTSGYHSLSRAILPRNWIATPRFVMHIPARHDADDDATPADDRPPNPLRPR
jgi:hypothetical protein